eukprot:4534981-Amphidinium_carterae.1
MIRTIYLQALSLRNKVQVNHAPLRLPQALLPAHSPASPRGCLQNTISKRGMSSWLSCNV